MRAACLAAIAAACGAAAAAPPVEVIYSEIAGDASNEVPGRPDLRFSAMLNLNSSPDGTRWIFKGFADDGQSAVIDVMVVGQGTSGETIAVEGEQAVGFGRIYEFFDSEAGINDHGEFVFGARFDPPNTDSEILIGGDGQGSLFSVVRQGDPAPGLIDEPGHPSDDEIFGNSLNTARIDNNGVVSFRADNIDNLFSLRDSALYIGLDVLFQELVERNGLVFDSFSIGNFERSADGANWIFVGDVDLSFSTQNAAVSNNQIVVAPGDDLTGNGDVVDAVFDVQMKDRQWIARGDYTDDRDWVVHSLSGGSLVAQSGSPIIDGTGESWGDSILLVNLPLLIAGETDFADPDANQVLVVGGVTNYGRTSLPCRVALRSGMPIDLDGNGAFDDDVYLRTFSPNDGVFAEDGWVYLFVTLRDDAGTNLGDAFIRVLPPDCVADLTGSGSPSDPTFGMPDGVVDVSDFFFFLDLFVGDGSCGDIDGSGAKDVNDFFAYLDAFAAGCP